MRKKLLYQDRYDKAVAWRHTHSRYEPALENALQTMRTAKWRYVNHLSLHPQEYKFCGSVIHLNLRCRDPCQSQWKYCALLRWLKSLKNQLPMYLKFYRATA